MIDPIERHRLIALVDKIEHLVYMIAVGELVEEQAVQQLVEYSERGLTHRGATDVLTNWGTARKKYEQIINMRHENGSNPHDPDSGGP